MSSPAKTAAEPTHVSDTPPRGFPSQASVRSAPPFSLAAPDAVAQGLHALLKDYEERKDECLRLNSEIILKDWEISELRGEVADMKGRLQRFHNSMEQAAKFAAWVAAVKPDFMDYAVTCHGCARSEHEADVKKYACGTATCQPLNLCADCFRARSACVKCKRPMADENGWKKRRRLPPSWDARA